MKAYWKNFKDEQPDYSNNEIAGNEIYIVLMKNGEKKSPIQSTFLKSKEYIVFESQRNQEKGFEVFWCYATDLI